MSKIFDLDSPIMRFLSRLADLLWLNILVIVCSIPIFTIGASLSAMHYLLLKMVRNEEGYITKSFFKAFKDNFKQGTLLWLIFLAFAIVFGVDIYILNYSGATFPNWIRIVLVVVALIVFCVFLYTFPLQSHFVNTVRGTLKNAAIMVVAAFPRTLGMLAITAVPWIVLYLVTAALPIVVMFGISAPSYVCAMLYSPLFKKFEPEEEEKDPDAMPEGLYDDTPVQNPSMIDAADRRAKEEDGTAKESGQV